jgi:hypothetical protein
LKKYFTLRPAGQGVVERAGLLSKLQSAGDIVAACSGLDWRTTDDRPITARSPSQNGYIERLVGSIRRECFEHVIMLGEGRLRRILKLYADYHNGVRTQLSGQSRASPSRSPSHRHDRSNSMLGGLHDHYVRT